MGQFLTQSKRNRPSTVSPAAQKDNEMLFKLKHALFTLCQWLDSATNQKFGHARLAAGECVLSKSCDTRLTQWPLNQPRIL